MEGEAGCRQGIEREANAIESVWRLKSAPECHRDVSEKKVRLVVATEGQQNGLVHTCSGRHREKRAASLENGMVEGAVEKGQRSHYGEREEQNWGGGGVARLGKPLKDESV